MEKGVNRLGLSCLLISVNTVIIPYPVYPLGIACLSRALEAGGHFAENYDLLSAGGIDPLRTILQKSPPDLIGLSLRNLDTVDSTNPVVFVRDVLPLMELIRAESKAPVVLGGPAFSILPDEIMALLQADYGIVGEGEHELVRLADGLERNIEPTEKIVYSSQQPSPWGPARHDPDVARYYLEHGGMLNVQTKRGCPYRCAYCSYPNLEGHWYRFQPPDEVALEVERITREFNCGYIFFTDSVFNDQNGHYLEVAEALIRRGNKTPWCAFFRPGNLGQKELRLLKRAGLAAMELGTDASCDTTLAAMDKGFGWHDVVKMNDLAVEESVACSHFIIFGGPDENQETLELGLANIERLKRSVVFGFTGIRILPDTAIHSRAVKEGLLKEGASLIEPVFYFSPEISAHDLNDRLKQAWNTRFDRIYPCSEMYSRIAHLHKKGYVGPMWDFLLQLQ